MDKILLVDDDERILKSFSKRLKKDGFHVETAQSGNEAMEKLKDISPDLIISDMRMPGMDGAELMNSIPAREGFSPGKIIFTAFDDGEAIKLAKVAEGGIFRVEKDRWETDLRPAIARALEIRSLQIATWERGRKIGELHALFLVTNNLSHKINNPLNSIFSSISFIKGLPEDKRFIKKIDVAMHKIHQIVIDIKSNISIEAMENSESVKEVYKKKGDKGDVGNKQKRNDH